MRFWEIDVRIGKGMLSIIICVFLVLSLSGCWNRRELATFSILMGMGIDKAEELGKIQLTAQIVKPGDLKSEGGSDAKAYFTVQAIGDTVFDTVRNFTKETNRKIYLPHSQVLIFGRDIATEGVQKYTDFFVRDHETRLRTHVLVARGEAGKILDVESKLEKVPAVGISHLLKAQNATSEAIEVDLKQFICRLMSKTTAPIAPLIEISGEGEKETLRIPGIAVFKQDKLAGELTGGEARGLLWVIGEIKSGIIIIDCPSGEDKISMEIIRASSKVIPKIIDDQIYITVKIEEEGHIGDQECPDKLSLPDIKELEQKKASVIRSEVLASLEKAQKLNTDIFGFGEAVHQKYPKQWDDLEKRWDDVFPEIEVEILVDARVRRSGTLIESVSQ